jgi:transcriptional regulator with XRE-family HTH domain
MSRDVYTLAAMNLSQYIKLVGDAEFGKKFGVTRRAAMSWRLGDRLPKPETAQKIVAKTPVTWDGIYGKSARTGGRAA